MSNARSVPVGIFTGQMACVVANIMRKRPGGTENQNYNLNKYIHICGFYRMHLICYFGLKYIYVRRGSQYNIHFTPIYLCVCAIVCIYHNHKA